MASGNLQGAIDEGRSEKGSTGAQEAAQEIAKSATSVSEERMQLAQADSFETFYTEGAQAWSNQFRDKGPTAGDVVEATKVTYRVYQNIRDAIPPGHPITGDPAVDRGIDVFNTITSGIEKAIESLKISR